MFSASCLAGQIQHEEKYRLKKIKIQPLPFPFSAYVRETASFTKSVADWVILKMQRRSLASRRVLAMCPLSGFLFLDHELIHARKGIWILFFELVPFVEIGLRFVFGEALAILIEDDGLNKETDETQA